MFGCEIFPYWLQACAVLEEDTGVMGESSVSSGVPRNGPHVVEPFPNPGPKPENISLKNVYSLLGCFI